MKIVKKLLQAIFSSLITININVTMVNGNKNTIKGDHDIK